ncbi:superoxide dismutase [Candidatus Pacearchaeota archaeon]|nr:superoxide dismutase [Candidatus Pacearchaeota archaeon]
MKFFLPKLEYEYSALEPWLDAKTMEIHYSKHHKTYCDKLNLALENHPEFFKEDVNEILAGLNQLPEEIRTAVRNNGGGFANHNLYWEIMTGDVKKRELKGDIKKAIEEKFGSFEEFKQNFNAAALMHFGSGWVWLVLDNGELKIVSTSNQDNPITEGKTPILCIDLWEHAYYLHYQNRRADFIEAWWNVVNWEKVNEKYLNAA